MPLGHAAIQELTDELETLKRQRDEIDGRIGAIELLLRHPARAAVTRKRRATKPATRKLTKETALGRFVRPVTPPPKSSTQVGGLRAALKNVLASGPQVPRAVIDALKGSGYHSSGGITPIETRVYNELHRMKRDGLAVRDAEGRYALAS